MSDRDRQDRYNRSRQYGSHPDDDYNSPRQTNQWQSESYRQQGGDWQQDRQSGGSDDNDRDYRFSGQGSSSNRDQSRGRGAYGQGSSGQGSYGQSSYGQPSSGNYPSRLSDDDLRDDQRSASRNYESARSDYGQHNDRGGRTWRQSGQGGYGNQTHYGRSGTSGYAGRNYDASGGNDFGNFTSEDYGGRDFYGRSGGAAGGMRSSESYRPSYGPSSWFNHDDDDRDGRYGQSRSGRGKEDYGSWREYGENRGFLQRAGDEVASWFGDEEASRRREQDRQQDDYQSRTESHRGRGPSNYTRSDERIREDANDRLTHDHHVDASNVTVTVKDGELTLDGTVNSRASKRRAEDAVEHISGVKHVQNNLRVQERSSSSNYGSSNYSQGNYGASGGSYSGSGSSSYGQGSSSGITGQSGGSSPSSSTGSTGSRTDATGSTSATGSSGASTTPGSATSSGSSTGALGSTSATSGSTSGSTSTVKPGEKTS